MNEWQVCSLYTLGLPEKWVPFLLPQESLLFALVLLCGVVRLCPSNGSACSRISAGRKQTKNILRTELVKKV